MRFPEAIDKLGVTLKTVSEESGVSYATIKNLYKERAVIKTYDLAKSLMLTLNGMFKLKKRRGSVTLEELCEPATAPTKRRRKPPAPAPSKAKTPPASKPSKSPSPKRRRNGRASAGG